MKTPENRMQWLTAAVAVLFVAGPALAQVNWDGALDTDPPAPNTSGNWNTAVNWVGDLVPSSTDNAVLVSVTANRTVTVDSATTANRIIFEQSDANYINKLSLDANLTLSRSSASSGNAVWTATLTEGATVNNVVTDLNGYQIIVANPASTTSGPSFTGVFNFNSSGSSIRTNNNAGHFGLTINGVVNVTADGSIGKFSSAGTGNTTYSFTSASAVTIEGAVLSIYTGNAGSGTQNRGINVTNNGQFDIRSDAALSVRLGSNATGSVGNARFTNSATGNLIQAGRIEMKANGNATSVQTISNNGSWTLSGSNAVIRRLDSSASVFLVPSVSNISTGTLRGNSSSDTLEFDEQIADGTRRMTITNNGLIAPGAGSQDAGLGSVGDLILRDIDVTMGSHANATVALDLGGTAIGEFDRLRLMTGLTDAAGAGTLTLEDIDNNNLGTLQIWKVNSFDPGLTPFSITLIEAGSVVGQFATVKLDGDTFIANELDAGGGKKYALSYTSDSVVLNYIPEPGTVVLAIGGLALMLLRRGARG